MTWLGFDFDTPQFVIQDDATQLWPSLIICGLIYVLRLAVNYTFMARGNRITQYKIDTAKPDWLVLPKNGATNRHRKTKKSPSLLTRKQYTQIVSFIDKLAPKEANTLCTYASEINLSNAQIRGLKSYFTQLKQRKVHVSKYLESTFKLCCIVPISVYGMYVIYLRHDFFVHHWKQWIHYGDDIHDSETMHAIERCEHNPANEPFRQIYDDWMLWYYIISLGYHLNRALMQFHNPARKDFVALFIHHWLTLALILCSFVGGKVRCGCIILSIHESSDIFLELAKVCSYHSNFLMADVFFVFFFLSWIAMRMCCFCYKLLYSAWLCGLSTCWIGNAPLIYPCLACGFLYPLEGLHVYWFLYILKIVSNKVAGKRISDTRSGNESESEDVRKKNDKDDCTFKDKEA